MFAYGTQQLGPPASFFLNAILVGCVVELFTLPLFGKLSDRIGRRTVYMIGAVFVAIYGFLFFELVETRDPMYIVLAYIGGMALSRPRSTGCSRRGSPNSSEPACATPAPRCPTRSPESSPPAPRR